MTQGTKTINITLKVWRQKGPKHKGRLETIPVKDVPTDMSFLEMLDVVNERLTLEGKEPIEFDNDWNVLDGQDEAHVEVSTNGGSTWTGIWDQIGTDIRNKHQAIDVTGLLGGQSNVSVRVRVVQPGWDWWWVLDNFSVYGKIQPRFTDGL